MIQLIQDLKMDSEIFTSPDLKTMRFLSEKAQLFQLNNPKSEVKDKIFVCSIFSLLLFLIVRPKHKNLHEYVFFEKITPPTKNKLCSIFLLSSKHTLASKLGIIKEKIEFA